MQGPERLDTARLILRRPRMADAPAIYARYAADPEVTRWLGWPRHLCVEDSEAFIASSESDWTRNPAGPYLIERRADARLVGSTGFGFESPVQAMTGYVLARDAWGQGLATEALRAITNVAPSLGVTRLYALCHVDHAASARVLEKCGYTCEGVLPRHTVFPNSGLAGPLDVLGYARSWNPGPGAADGRPGR